MLSAQRSGDVGLVEVAAGKKQGFAAALRQSIGDTITKVEARRMSPFAKSAMRKPGQLNLGKIEGYQVDLRLVQKESIQLNRPSRTRSTPKVAAATR